MTMEIVTMSGKVVASCTGVIGKDWAQASSADWFSYWQWKCDFVRLKRGQQYIIRIRTEIEPGPDPGPLIVTPLFRGGGFWL
jgi:hypothetical protein